MSGTVREFCSALELLCGMLGDLTAMEEVAVANM